MSGQIPHSGSNNPDPNEPPPPYSAAVESFSQDKTGVYPSAPVWANPPTTDLPSGYPPHSGYSAQPGYPQSGYPPQSGYSPQHPGSYSPQPPGTYGSAYTQQPGSHTTSSQPTTVIVQQPLLPSGAQLYRELPVQTVCPKCQAPVVTVTLYENGTLSWLLCAILCLIGCDAGCCLIPFCVDSCKDVVHVCPNCHQSISRFNRL